MHLVYIQKNIVDFLLLLTYKLPFVLKIDQLHKNHHSLFQKAYVFLYHNIQLYHLKNINIYQNLMRPLILDEYQRITQKNERLFYIPYMLFLVDQDLK